MRKKATNTDQLPLPFSKLPLGLTEADLKYPKYDSKDKMVYDVGEHGSYTLYEVSDRNGTVWWAIATLGIAKGRGNSDRTYAVKVDNGSLVRVGRGPHVKRTVTVYVRQSRAKDLEKLQTLYMSGLTAAGQVRDRISSRRAQGQLMRAEGRSSWLWDK